MSKCKNGEDKSRNNGSKTLAIVLTIKFMPELERLPLPIFILKLMSIMIMNAKMRTDTTNTITMSFTGKVTLHDFEHVHDHSTLIIQIPRANIDG